MSERYLSDAELTARLDYHGREFLALREEKRRREAVEPAPVLSLEAAEHLMPAEMFAELGFPRPIIAVRAVSLDNVRSRRASAVDGPRISGQTTNLDAHR